MTPFSLTVVGPAVNVTVGPTLLTVTGRCAVLPVEPSLSVADPVTIGEAGPSCKIHLKLPVALVLLSLPGSFRPTRSTARADGLHGVDARVGNRICVGMFRSAVLGHCRRPAG